MPPARPTGRNLASSRTADPRAALAGAGLAAAAIGLIGTDGGIPWVIAGVWTARAMAGAPLGVAWGLAALAAGIRWGTLSLGDLEVATRVAGPTLAAGPVLVRVGMAVALFAALVGESRDQGFLARSWGERAAAGLAVAAMVPLYLVAGPEEALALGTVAWPLGAVALTAAVLLLRPAVRLVPSWAPPVFAATGASIAIFTS